MRTHHRTWKKEYAAPNTRAKAATPDQLKAGLERLATSARMFDRDPAEIEIIYRTHQFQLEKNGSSGSGRLPFVGNADQIAGDIRQYQDLGVGSLVLDFLRQTEDLDEILGRMEEFADQVFPKV